MARKEITHLVDDLDGTTITQGGGQSVRFSFDGKDYIIELTTSNIATFKEILRPYIQNGQRQYNRGHRRPKADKSIKIIRAWALENGYQITDRGRIPAPILAAYKAAH